MTEEAKANTMMDTLHRCLMCDAPAHECDEEDLYMCSDNECGFTWKVERCGK